MALGPATGWPHDASSLEPVTVLTRPELPQLLENGTRPPGFLARAVDIWKYRELLGNLVRRELKVKYKNSVLGFVWTLLNPLLYLVIFTIVFSIILKNPVPRYGLLLLSGLLPFNLFSVGLTAATTSITANGPLVQKVWFPREILPLASIGANLITFFFQMTILLTGLALFRQTPQWSMLWLLVPALILTLMIGAGLGLMLSALNVYFRDVQHFLELGLLTWFWLTPVVYNFQLVGQALIARVGAGGERWAALNPMLPIVITFQRVLYNPLNFDAKQQEGFALMLHRSSLWYLENLGISALFGMAFLYFGFKVFSRLEANLGEEL
jgi:ABC-2 type transport system permease protein